jgi:hypothetical protein
MGAKRQGRPRGHPVWWACALWLALCLWAPWTRAHAAGPDTVVLAAPDDPYYALADEISQDEGLPLCETLAEALAQRPTYLVWVVAPARLSEDVLLAFGREVDASGSGVAVGIISGRNLDEARDLWARDQLPATAAEGFAVVNPTKSAGLAPGITRLDGEARTTTPLTTASLIETLTRTAVVQISMEGAAGSWFDVGSGVALRATDIPALPNSIIQFYGCSTFRPWAEQSIALACIGQGARAYCGFVFNSVPGTRFGDYQDTTLRYTWADFPIGQMVQIQNQAAGQAYAAAPHFYLLGDPRLYCSTGAPYEVVADEEVGDRRVIELAGLPAGLIPVHIAGGAGYDFAQVSGLAGLDAGSSHCNRDVQMVDIAGDKYLVFDNLAGRQRVTLTLRSRAPWYWPLWDGVRAIVEWKAAYGLGSELNGYLGLAAMLALAIGKVRGKYAWRDLGPALVPGAALAALWLGYLHLFGSRIILTNVPVVTPWWIVAGVIVSATLGALLYLRARRPLARLAAVALPNLPSLAMALLLALLALVRPWLAQGHAAIDRAGYPLSLFLVDALAGLVLYGAAYGLLGAIVGRRQRARRRDSSVNT